MSLQPSAPTLPGVPAAKSPAPPGRAGAAVRLSGAQRAAAVLVQMGPERASRILREMSEAEVTALAAAVASLPVLEVPIVTSIMGDFLEGAKAQLGVSQGGVSAARALLEQRLSPRQAQEILSSLGAGPPALPSALGFLSEVPVAHLAAFLASEHPQTTAVVLAQVPPEAAGAVLSALPAELQPDVARRVAQSGRVAPEVLDMVAGVLRRRLADHEGEAAPAASGGVPSLVDILTRVDRGTEKGILAEFDREDPELADKVRGLLFVFDDVVRLDDRTLQKVLRHIVPGELAIALKASSEEVRSKFTRNLSERAASDLAEEMELLGPVRLSQVDAAQASVVKVVRELDAAGEILLERGDDDLVV